jgi:hypothetical protein
MSKVKYTPGPWIAKINNPMSQFFNHTIYDNAGNVVLNLNGAEDKAHLIAAAPEMLEALELALEASRGNKYAYGKIRDVIAKARGEL